MQITDIMSAYQGAALNNENPLEKKESQTENESAGVYSWKSDVVSISSTAMQKAQSATGEESKNEESSGGKDKEGGGTQAAGGSGGGDDDKQSRIQELTAKLQQLQSKLGRARNGEMEGGEMASIMAEIGAVNQELAALQSQM